MNQYKEIVRQNRITTDDKTIIYYFFGNPHTDEKQSFILQVRYISIKDDFMNEYEMKPMTLHELNEISLDDFVDDLITFELNKWRDEE